MRFPKTTLKDAIRDLGARADLPPPTRSPKSMPPVSKAPDSTATLDSLDDLQPDVSAPATPNADVRVDSLVSTETRPDLENLIGRSSELALPTDDESAEVLARFTGQTPSLDSLDLDLQPSSGRSLSQLVDSDESLAEESSVIETADAVTQAVTENGENGPLFSQSMPPTIRTALLTLAKEYSGMSRMKYDERLVIAKQIHRLTTEYGLNYLKTVISVNHLNDLNGAAITLSTEEAALAAELKAQVEQFCQREHHARFDLTPEQKYACFALFRFSRLQGVAVRAIRAELKLWPAMTAKWPEEKASVGMTTDQLVPALFKKHGVAVAAPAKETDAKDVRPSDAQGRVDPPVPPVDVKSNGHAEHDPVPIKTDASTSAEPSASAAAPAPSEDAVTQRLDAMQTQLNEQGRIQQEVIVSLQRQLDDARERIASLVHDLDGARQNLQFVELERNGATERADAANERASRAETVAQQATDALAAATTAKDEALQKAQTAEWTATERGNVLAGVEQERDTLLQTSNDLRTRIQQLELQLQQPGTTAPGITESGSALIPSTPVAVPALERAPMAMPAVPAAAPTVRTSVNIAGQQLDVESSGAAAVFIVPITVNNNR